MDKFSVVFTNDFGKYAFVIEANSEEESIQKAILSGSKVAKMVYNNVEVIQIMNL